MGYFKRLFTDQLPLWTEGCGTFLLVLIGTSALTALGMAGQATTGSVMLLATLAFGLTLGCLVWLFGPISGGHFNPAVTTFQLLREKIGWGQWLYYLVAQFSGAILASIVVAMLYGTPGVEAGLGAPSPMTVMGPMAAVSAELLGTAILLITVVLSTGRHANRHVQAVMIGLALSLGMLMALGISGGSLNPARSFGPQLVAADMTFWWVYILGPLLAAVMVGGLSRVFNASQVVDKISTSEADQPIDAIEDQNVELQLLAQQAAAQYRVEEQDDQVAEIEDILPSTIEAIAQSPAPSQPSFGGLIVEEDEHESMALAAPSIEDQVEPHEDPKQPQSNQSQPPQSAPGHVTFVEFASSDNPQED